MNVRCTHCQGRYFMVIGEAKQVRRHWWGLWAHRDGYVLGCVSCGTRQTVTKDEVIMPGSANPASNGQKPDKRPSSRIPDKDMNWNPSQM